MTRKKRSSSSRLENAPPPKAAPRAANDANQPSSQSLEALRRELAEKNQLVWNQKIQLMRVERELEHLKNRPAVKLITRLSQIPWLTRLWIGFYHTARAITGGRCQTAPPQHAPEIKKGTAERFDIQSRGLNHVCHDSTHGHIRQPHRNRFIGSTIWRSLTHYLHVSKKTRQPITSACQHNTLPPTRSVQVILSADAASPSLQQTLASLRRWTDLDRNLLTIVLNSDDPSSTQRIAAWTADFPPHQIITCVENSPETITRILAAREADACFIRAGVVLAPHWLEGLRAAAYSSPAIATASPLILNPQTAFRLLPGDNLITAARKLRLLSNQEVPSLTAPLPQIHFLRRDHLLDPETAHDKHAIHALTADVLVCAPEASAAQQPFQTPGFPTPAALEAYHSSEISLVSPATLALFCDPTLGASSTETLRNPLALANELIARGHDVRLFFPGAAPDLPASSPRLFEPVRENDPAILLQHIPRQAVLLAADAPSQAIVNRLRTLNPDLAQLSPDLLDADDPAPQILAELRTHAARQDSALSERAADPTPAIVIPIHNELGAVRRCLESIVRHTAAPYRVILVDDASDEQTAAFLAGFAAQYPHFTLLRNPVNLGFVGSANRGMAAAPGGDIVLLNSDTIVTPRWLEKLRRCAASDARIGIISPLSNQSSQLRLRPNPGDSIDETAEKIERLSLRTYPDVVTPEGWCFYIRRAVYEALGGFDPVYGRGYCEESDYAMRALANGWRLVCCDDTFIYHQGRVSFKDERGPGYETNRRTFDRRWAPLYQKAWRRFKAEAPLEYLRIRYNVSRPVGFLALDEDNAARAPLPFPNLADPATRSRIEAYQSALADFLKHPRRLAHPPRFVFVVSTLDPSGGMISIVQLINDMVLAGCDVKLVTLRATDVPRDPTLLTEPILFADETAALRHFPEADCVIGTHWRTIYFIADLFRQRADFVPAYFVQDFEPWFYPDTEPEKRETVALTYRLTPYCFAKTRWICEMVRAAGGRIHEVPPALDLNLFYPCGSEETNQKKIILTLLRPSAERRGFQTVLRVFGDLLAGRSDFELHAFGCTDEELARHAIPFSFVNHGRVSNDRLPQLYRRAWLFAEFSDFHGFGRTIAEALACGVPCVLTDSGGIGQFAVHEENSLIAQAGDVEALKRLVCRMLDEPALRARLAARAPERVAPFERRNSMRETLAWLNSIVYPQSNG